MPDIADLIPAGKKLATVDDTTNRLNEPTMEAIQQDLIPTIATTVDDVVPPLANDAALRPMANSVIIIGSSLEEQNGAGASTLDASGGAALRARGWFHWANAYLGAALTLVRNAGIGGNRYDQMLARFDADVLAYPSAWVGIGSPTNSVTAGHTAAQIIAELDAMLDKCAAAGRRAFVLTVAPRTNINTTAMRRVQATVNDYIRRLALTRYGVVPIEGFTPIANAETGDPATATTVDGTHFSIAGAARLGRTVADALRPFVVPFGARPSTLVDPYSVIDNPLVSSTDWTTLSGSGSPTYPAASDGLGVKASLAITGNTSLSAIRGVSLTEPIADGRFAPGDVIQGQVRLRWSSLMPLSTGNTDCVPIVLVRHMTGSTITYSQSTLFSATSEWVGDQSPMPSSGEMVLTTWRATIGATIDSLVVILGWRGAASVNLEFEHLSVRKES